VASWFDRSKPLQGRAGRDLMTRAALLLLVSGSQALSEDEPAASAPLPPLLRGAPAEAGGRQMPDLAPSRNLSDPGVPVARVDRPRSQLSHKKPRLHSASYLNTSTAKKRETPARLGNHSIDAVSRRQGHHTVVSEKRQRPGGSPAGLALGQLSPPSDYPDPAIGSATEPPAELRQAPPPYYPNYFAGPSGYRYAPAYPYAWAPPGPGVFR
jgi:hypothetical protein